MTLALIAVMAAAFAGCGKKDSGTADDANSRTEKTAETEDGKSKGMQRGTVTGNVYENQALGIRCQLGEELVFSDEKELMELSGIAEELTDNKALQQAIEATRSVYDMYAHNEDGSNSINVMLENLDLLNELEITEQEYVEMGKDQLESAMESMGVTDFREETGTETFAGASHSCINTEMEMQGIKIYQKQICIKADGMMGVITFSSYEKETLEEMAAAFSAL